MKSFLQIFDILFKLIFKLETKKKIETSRRADNAVLQQIKELTVFLWEMLLRERRRNLRHREEG